MTERPSCTTCKAIVLETFQWDHPFLANPNPPKKDGMAHLAAPVNTLWPNGQEFRVWFINGSDYPEYVKRVKDTVPEWEKYANVKFSFPATWDSNSPPEIRIRFWKKPEGFKDDDKSHQTQDGYWSYLGLDCRDYAQNDKQPDFWRPTMSLQPGNLGDPVWDKWFYGCILHEFGHTLGFMHEHQRPDGQTYLKYNVKQVYAYYGAAPNNWSKKTVDEQVLNFNKYAGQAIAGNKFDTKSIMMYSVPKKILLDGNPGIDDNNVLSDGDKTFVSRLYPKVGERSPFLPSEIIPEPVKTTT